MDWMRTLKPDAIISDPFKVERFGVFCDLLVNHDLVILDVDRSLW